jgi:hypothetical protein
MLRTSLPEEVTRAMRKGDVIGGDDFNESDICRWYVEEKEAFHETNAASAQADPWYRYMRYVNNRFGLQSRRFFEDDDFFGASTRPRGRRGNSGVRCRPSLLPHYLHRGLGQILRHPSREVCKVYCSSGGPSRQHPLPEWIDRSHGGLFCAPPHPECQSDTRGSCQSLAPEGVGACQGALLVSGGLAIPPIGDAE